MARVIAISELKKDFYRLVESVWLGDTIIVTKRGKMMAKLEPVEAQRMGRASSAKKQPSSNRPAARARRKKS